MDDVAGTTVDPVDELIELGGRTWRFIDTAGIRKRVKEASGHEYYASLRTSTAIDRAEVAVLVARRRRSRSPSRTCGSCRRSREAGRALVIAFNKWDLVDEERRYYLDREIERELVQVQWAPRINVTARTGWHVDRLVPALDKALEGWETRVPTGALNAFLGRLVAEHPHPVRSGKQPKIMFGTQAVRGAARRSRCSPPASSTPATSGSSSAASARSSALRAPRSCWSSGCARGASADPGRRTVKSRAGVERRVRRFCPWSRCIRWSPSAWSRWS